MRPAKAGFFVEIEMAKRLLTTNEQPGIRTAVLCLVSRQDGDEEKESDHQIEMSFSSEAPVERYGYEEILDHDASSIRLGQRQQNMPLLFNHNRDDLIGKVERVWLGDDRRLHCTARFAKTARGAECEQMVRDGILTNVSFMYQIYDYREESKDVFRAVDWEPFEVSLVTVPADASVGVGRALSPTNKSENVRSAQGDIIMEEDKKTAIADAVSAERARATEIEALCRQHNIDDNYRNQAISEGLSIDQVRQHILENYRSREAKPAASIAVDMSPRERQQYSLLRALRMMANPVAGGSFERDVSQELQRRYGLADTGGIYIPSALGSRAWTGNDNLIPTEHHAEEFVSYLRERSVLAALGARTLSGLRGNVDIPKMTGGATTYWGVDTDITASDLAFGNLTMSMKQVGALTTISRSLLMQSSPDAEQLVRDDFFGALAEAVDTAAISGDASDDDVPTGLINMTDVGVISLGTNGGLITWDTIVDMETKVRESKVRNGRFAYLANPTTMGYLKKLTDSTGRPLWQNATSEGAPATLNGYTTVDSTLVPSNLTKGTASKKCSAFIFGAWNEMLLGEWGVVEVLSNPYGDAFKSGGLSVRALQNVDVAVRRPSAFAVVRDFDPSYVAPAGTGG